MSSRKRKARDVEDAATAARRLVSETSVRSCLRAHDLLLVSVARAGYLGTVSLAAALWVQGVLEQAAAVVCSR